SFDDITCTSAGNCVAVGSFANDFNDPLPFQDTETAGAWSAAAGPAATMLPPGSVTGTLYGVACAAAGSCQAVGYDSDVEGNSHLLAATLAAGSWSVSTLPDP